MKDEGEFEEEVREEMGILGGGSGVAEESG